MKRANVILLSLLIFLLFPVYSFANTTTSQRVYVKLLLGGVELDQSATQEIAAMPAVMTVEAAVPDAMVQLSPEFGLWQRLTIAADANMDAVLSDLRALPTVTIAERAPIREITVKAGSEREVSDLPNDPLASFQWHLATVNAFAAWDEAPAASDVVVAILDNGVDIDHPDLQSIIWTNPSEVGGQSGYDDDSNGFEDDIYGWDAYEQDGNPDAPSDVDSPGHGTHCSGIAAAIHDNGVGVVGLGRGAKIMAVRIGSGRQIYNTVEGLVYAAVNGADVISMSFAGPSESSLERDIIDYAVSQGAVVVAAAGNEGSTNLTYPAAYPNVIAVAATDLDNDIASFSNRSWWVQAAAPGVDIFSTYINGYGYSTGTSMATPLVAGLVAMLKGSDPSMNQAEVLARIQQGARPIANAHSLNTPVGVIDAWRSVLPDRPVVAFNGLYVDDSDDGRLSGGETADVVFNMELLGAGAENLSLRLFPIYPYDWEYDISGEYTSTGQSVGEFDATFSVNVYDNYPTQTDHPAVLIVDADGWEDTLSVRIPVDLPYVTVRGGDLIASVSDYGAIGYKDYVSNEVQSDGVGLAGDFIGQLYHGSFIITNQVNVSDNAYGSGGGNSHDFEVKSGMHWAPVAGPDGRETWQCTYSDQQSNSPVDVEVRQTVTAYEDGGNIVYVDYAVKRRIGSPDDMFVGVFCDWDILNLMTNTVRYNSALRLSYMRGSGYNGMTRYAGVVALGNKNISGVRAINNATYDYSDSEKIDYMSNGTHQAATTQESDWSHIIAVELDNVGSTSYQTASFAIVSAETEQALLDFAAEALATHGSPDAPPPAQNGGLPARFELSRAWPNPFNASSRISLSLNMSSDIALTVYDVLGRSVATLYSGTLSAGSHDFTWNGLSGSGHPVAAGVYIIEARTENLHARQKVVLVK